MVREIGVQSQVESYQWLKNGTWCRLNIQHYKVRIKGKVEQSREKSSALPHTLCVVAIEKGTFGSHSTKVAKFTYLLTLSHIISEVHSFEEKNNWSL